MSDPTPSRRLVGDAVLEDPLVRELLDARLICVLATYDEAGTIHAVPMWFAQEEGFVVLATGSRSRKVRNLEADARATLVVHDSRPGFEVCGASIAGVAEIVRGAASRRPIERVHRRYVTERGEKLVAVRTFLESDDVALRFRPEQAMTWDERATAANAALRSSGAARSLVPTSPREQGTPKG